MTPYKKFLIGCAMVGFIGGCAGDFPKTKQKTEDETSVKTTTRINSLNALHTVSHDGHDYVVLTGSAGRGALVHSSSCPANHE